MLQHVAKVFQFRVVQVEVLVLELLLVEVGCQRGVVDAIALANLGPGCHVLVVDLTNGVRGIKLKKQCKMINNVQLITLSSVVFG